MGLAGQLMAVQLRNAIIYLGQATGVNVLTYFVLGCSTKTSVWWMRRPFLSWQGPLFLELDEPGAPK